MNSENLHSPIEKKESFRRLQGYRKSCDVAISCFNTKIVCVADREGDIFDIFHDAEQRDSIKANWLIRSRINRAIADPDGKRKPHLLHEEIARSPVVGAMQIELPARNKQKASTANVQIKIKPIILHPPIGRRGKLRLLPAAVHIH